MHIPDAVLDPKVVATTTGLLRTMFGFGLARIFSRRGPEGVPPDGA